MSQNRKALPARATWHRRRGSLAAMVCAALAGLLLAGVPSRGRAQPPYWHTAPTTASQGSGASGNPAMAPTPESAPAAAGDQGGFSISRWWNSVKPTPAATASAPTPAIPRSAGPLPMPAAAPAPMPGTLRVAGSPAAAPGVPAGPCLPSHALGSRGFTALPAYPQGEYVERDRTLHIPSYRLRADDQLEFVYRITRNETSKPYEFGVGDTLRLESIADPQLNRDLTVQPDGTITVRLLGQVRAARRTVDELRTDLEERYTQYYKVPSITVTPLTMNTKLEDLRATVVARFGNGGQVREARVTPEGTIQLPVIGSIPVQGLTIDEVKREVDERYLREIEGVEVMPVLVQRAPRFVYVIGEVRQPGRYTLEAPTSVMQAISLAGGWNVGANLHQVVVFRRDDHWRMMATMLDMWDPLYGNTPCAPHDIWLGDTDVVVVPKMKILVADEFIELIFTRGLYGVIPFQGIGISMAKLSTI